MLLPWWEITILLLKADATSPCPSSCWSNPVQLSGNYQLTDQNPANLTTRTTRKDVGQGRTLCNCVRIWWTKLVIRVCEVIVGGRNLVTELQRTHSRSVRTNKAGPMCRYGGQILFFLSEIGIPSAGLQKAGGEEAGGIGSVCSSKAVISSGSQRPGGIAHTAGVLQWWI